MSYSEFKDHLLVALMRAANAASEADPNSLGIVNAREVMADVRVAGQEQWLIDAIKGFETNTWIERVVAWRDGPLIRFTDRGREQAGQTLLQLHGLSGGSS
jgi:hypothetical protein